MRSDDRTAEGSASAKPPPRFSRRDEQAAGSIALHSDFKQLRTHRRPFDMGATRRYPKPPGSRLAIHWSTAVAVAAVALLIGVTALPTAHSEKGTLGVVATSPSAKTLGREVGSTSACSGDLLGSILVSPEVATVSGSASRTFSAEAISTCGFNITNITHFSWRLSSTSVGSLGSTTGSVVIYTACVAPMDGVLHLTGYRGNVTLNVSASIRIGGGTFGSTPGDPGAPALPNDSPSPLSREIGLLLVGVLLTGGALLILWGWRSRPRPPTEPTP
jgi:hypothetical protein